MEDSLTPHGLCYYDWTRPLTPPATNRHLKNVTPKTNGSNITQTASTKPTTIINKNNNTTTDDLVADSKRVNNKLEITENLVQKYDNNNDLASSPTAATVVTNFDESTVQSLALRLQNELRRAKSQHLACTEVLLPSDLLNRIASKLIVMSEKEPCGIRGSIIYIEFEDEPNNTRRIASLQLDPNTVSTFELYLTLKQDRSGWTSILPQFLK
ncbi:protein scylla isoform X2 [Contarinia nasturtii]|uniref:protein scylla isoform X2 n=1 Tax=Contarinia nasturtii TaxID=265458 RepID=UPI0012D40B08|nr:protein scylla isoform X2 [Contarinia nasturtii]